MRKELNLLILLFIITLVYYFGGAFKYGCTPLPPERFLILPLFFIIVYIICYNFIEKQGIKNNKIILFLKLLLYLFFLPFFEFKNNNKWYIKILYFLFSAFLWLILCAILSLSFSQENIIMSIMYLYSFSYILILILIIFISTILYKYFVKKNRIKNNIILFFKFLSYLIFFPLYTYPKVNRINKVAIFILWFFIFLYGYIFLLRPLSVAEGTCMLPTMGNNEIILTHKKFPFSKINRGYLISFDQKIAKDSLVGKRVIGLPGENITIKNGYVYINNQFLKENYIKENRSTFGDKFIKSCETISIPQNYYFVMGDNRKDSMDSRTFGLVSFDDIYSYLPIGDTQNINSQEELTPFELPKIDEVYKRVNAIRVSKNLNPLEKSSQLEDLATQRALAFIEKRDQEYSLEKIIKDTGHHVAIDGTEITLWEYYNEDELVTTLTQNRYLNNDYPYIGIGILSKMIDDCQNVASVIIISKFP
jgi:signal peptidase I